MDDQLILRLEQLQSSVDVLTRAICRQGDLVRQGDPKDGLVGRQEIAELLAVSLPTVDRLVSDGRIPSTKIGTRRLFSPSLVLRAMEPKTESVN